MNTELEEKMQQAAEKISSLVQSDEIFKELIEVIFMSGASKMYAELAPLVEWVSVEERLPKVGEIVILKYKNGQIDLCKYGWSESMLVAYKDVLTHWRRIEL